MLSSPLEHHLHSPRHRGRTPPGAHAGAAGGAACGDLVRISLTVEGDRVADGGFDAHGCGATTAAGSAALELALDRSVLEAARLDAAAIAAELGGLSPGKRHAADLAADALHRALGAAARAGAELARDPGRTLVAMSGGVDSAVAALLSHRHGRDVVAVTLELWADPANDAARSCCSADAVRLARSVAHRMGLPHLTLDLRHEFRRGVVEPYLAEHGAGLTPNPCVRCNGDVRLDAMLAFADAIGAADLATGHYARVDADPAGPLLRAAADPGKDQTYMLAGLRPGSLARMRFPLGDLTKARVRALAAEAGVPVAARAESQDLCFLAGTDRAAFLHRHAGIEPAEGEIVASDGTLLGRHPGHHRFTVGQRRGLGVAAAEPLYVLATDAERNRVVAGTRAQLRTTRVTVRGARLLRDGARVDHVKLRYRAAPLPCRLTADAGPGRHGRLELELAHPVEGAAPGQVACLMEGERVIGSGTIGHGVPRSPAEAAAGQPERPS
jgi:tRNA-uridine 2-sulfurtransferase